MKSTTATRIFRFCSRADTATWCKPTAGNGLTQFFGSSTAANATITNTGTSATAFGLLDFLDNSTAGRASITDAMTGFTQFFDASTAGNATFNNSGSGGALFGSTIFLDNSSAGNATITSNSGGSTQFRQNSTAGDATITTNAGAGVFFRDASTGGNARFITNADGVFDMSRLTSAGMTAGSIEGAGSYFLGGKLLTLGGNNLSTTVSGTIADGGLVGGTGGSLTKVGTGTTILSGDNEYTGLTTITQGVLQLGNGGTTGSVAGDIVNNSVLAINRSNAFDYAGVISGTGALNHIGTGTTTLLGHNTYTGTTTVSAGTLLVNGSIVSPGLTVNGGDARRHRQLGSMTVNSGTLSPGNSIGTITINGNLVLGAGAIYRVEVSPTAADRTNVTGTATLAGTAQLVFGPGTYTSNSYTILSAAGGRSGTFDTVTTEGLPATLSASLSYTATDVLLVTLTSSIAPTLAGH